MNNNDFYIRNNSLQSDNSNKGKKKIVPVLILVLLVGVAGFLVYELKFKKDDTKKSDEYVEYDPNYKLEDGENRKELDGSGSDGLIDVEGNPINDSNSNVTSSNKAPDNILSNILSNVNKTSNSNITSNENKTSNDNSSSNTNRNIRVTGVSINEQNVTMYIGQTSSVSATVTPENATNKSVTWKSSDTNVVVVDNNGRLDAKKVGTANIIVTTNDGFKTSTVKVTVVAQSIPVTGVKLNTSSMTLSKNGKSILKATITPSNATNKEVTWKSSNTSVATVDQNGTVTAKNYGTANITVTTNDGKKTATVKVDVPQPPISSISISLKSNTVYVGSTSKADISYYPTDAANKTVTWTSSDTSVATVSQFGQIKGISYGVATITAITPNGKKANKVIKVEHNPNDYSIIMNPVYTFAGKDTSTKILVGYNLEVRKYNIKLDSYVFVRYNGEIYNVNTSFIDTTKINKNKKTASLTISEKGKMEEISNISVIYEK